MPVIILMAFVDFLAKRYLRAIFSGKFIVGQK